MTFFRAHGFDDLTVVDDRGGMHHSVAEMSAKNRSIMPNSADSSRTAAIVVVTHNRPDGLKTLLSDLAASKAPERIRELLVIDNGDSTSGGERICQDAQLPYPIRYFHQTSPKKSRALNFGLAWTTCPFIIFFDDDVRIEPEAVSAYMEAAERYGHQHHFAGRIVADVVEPPPSWLIPYLPSSARGFDYGTTESEIPQPIIVGSNWAAFRHDILAAGGFPEYLGPGADYISAGEETVLQMRLLAAGSRGVYLPKATVHHLVPATGNTYEFALHRRHLLGRATTLAEHVESGKPAPKYPPLWMFRRLVELYLRRLRETEPEARIETDASLAELKGRMSGYRYLRDRSLVLEYRPTKCRAAVASN